MDSIRAAVLDSRTYSCDDDELISNFDKLADLHGPAVFAAIFQIFTGLDLEEQSAEAYWRAMLLHRRRMSEGLGRGLDLIPALYDFLSSSPHRLANPRLIEENSYAKVIRETTHDSLTSLFNRHYFDEALEISISTAKRYDNDVALLFLDIDNFKEINDTFGHRYGDLVLQQIAQIILDEKRDSDIAARYGGEEFVLLMPHTQSVHGLVLAERLRQKIRETPLGSQQRPTTVTISGGLAAYPQNALDSTELVHHADSALYLAKGAGKNRISMYKEEKRRYLRVKYREFVKIKKLGFDSTPVFSGTSKDICIGGILFENPAPLPIGSRIQVSLPIQDGNPLLLIGTVVRIERYAEDAYDIGMTISFKEMEKIANTEIANFLQNNIV